MGIDHPLTEPTSRTSGKPPRPPANARRYLTVASVVAVVLVGLAVIVLAGIRLANRGEVLRGVSVESVDIGGLSPEDARDALADTVAARQTDPVVFTINDDTHELTPGRIDYMIDLDTTIDAAMAEGRDRGFLRNTLEHVQAFWTERELDLAATYDEAALDAWVDDLARLLDHDPTVGGVSVDPDSLEVTVAYPRDGVTVRRDETRAVALEGLAAPGPQTVPLPADIEPTPITDAMVDAVARQAERAVAAPLVLESPEANTSTTLGPSEIAPLISLRAVRQGTENETVELTVPVDAVEEAFEDRAEQFSVEPVSARFDVPREPPTQLDDKDDVTWRPRPADVAIVPSQDGWRFDAEQAAEQLSELLQEGRRQAELRLAVVEPELTTEGARELGITELLGTFTTYHACCATRVTNIQRLADMVDHTLVLPDEQFSINQISGERTCAKGFAAAGMILNGEIVDVCGGGVSQFGTTTVNAVFFSGLDPDAYQPHSFYISRYPMGREATLNYPSPDIDVRFTNDTGYGILVKTSYTPTSITVTFYGQNDVEEVRAIHGQPYNYKPPSTRERINRSLPPQSRRVVQSGSQGFSINVTRVITYEDGSEERDDWSNVYTPQIEVVEYNPERRPEPEPEPSPSPEDPDETETQDEDD